MSDTKGIQRSAKMGTGQQNTFTPAEAIADELAQCKARLESMCKYASKIAGENDKFRTLQGPATIEKVVLDIEGLIGAAVQTERTRCVAIVRNVNFQKPIEEHLIEWIESGRPA